MKFFFFFFFFKSLYWSALKKKSKTSSIGPATCVRRCFSASAAYAPSVLLTISASRCLVSILLGGAVQDSYLYSTDRYATINSSVVQNQIIALSDHFRSPLLIFLGGLFFILFFGNLLDAQINCQSTI